ncbi:MAG: hypothetical protein OXN88_11865 [Chloroflexota bacterium]|nr:hypothetical protein [Chloroflexota bacterium]
MSTFSVQLEVPTFIEAGLADGSMERVGGVIRNRESENNEVIAWVRQVGQVGQTVESSGELIENVMRSAGLSAPTVLNLLTSVMPLVNIAMAGYSLLDIISDIRTQNAAIERIYERIEEEFVQDRMANLVAALETGELWDKVNDPAYKRDHIGRMTDRLHEAVAHLREDFQDVLSFERSPENLARALRFQVMLIHVATMIVRGYMELNEDRLALEWLSSIMRGQRERTRRLVLALLGSHTAVYFHESVSDEIYERYLDIERWLRGKRDVLQDLVRNNRKRFWDEDAIDVLYVHVPVNRKELDNTPFYTETIPLAEFAIENYQRLEGFELELRSLSSSFKEWESIGSDQTGDHNGYVLLVNEALAQ